MPAISIKHIGQWHYEAIIAFGNAYDEYHALVAELETNEVPYASRKKITDDMQTQRANLVKLYDDIQKFNSDATLYDVFNDGSVFDDKEATLQRLMLPNSQKDHKILNAFHYYMTQYLYTQNIEIDEEVRQLSEVLHDDYNDLNQKLNDLESQIKSIRSENERNIKMLMEHSLSKIFIQSTVIIAVPILILGAFMCFKN